ncbi:MAG TPA: nitroreductase family protein [Lachnospiraceae bacterium]|nr:nitroreductase family protein [Lachnospiraceae bacterium]
MEFMQVIKNRKSVRAYKDEQISEEALQQILYTGCAAPVSNKDYKSIHITVVQSETMLERIRNAVNFSSDPLYGVPTLIIISSTKASVANVECFNAACIVENMLLASTNLNIASIYLTFFLQFLADKKDLLMDLGIPEGFSPISAVGIGYAKDITEDEENDTIKNRIPIHII